ncbi:MAG: BrnA antitoxin family protein [Proteobacteria bacterium]|nr:BrnA antitoxin family protein [Pseudomonadota bacterium]
MNNANTGKTVSFTLNQATPLSAEELAQLAALKHRKIDTSDIPSSPASAVWTRPGIPFLTENKRQISLRIDADVLAFFRESGKRYQTRINSVLREYMRAHAPKT